MAHCTDRIHLCSLSHPQFMNAGIPRGSHSSAQHSRESRGISCGWPPRPSKPYILVVPVACSVSQNLNPKPLVPSGRREC
ncbi:hypothetical protein CY34DRAFT_793368 [Suillus luteus UH-Slu-Lm8-n1]|uniref:Uncharacterized protein n=1 Tax=Suillus luteus UH-Slu-Lm8-n1 TaxID=930992 RepID=A0A0D0ALN3_9AGAM|nr:hypothetical protein CY34DRAFT_793368 [Suillus luteus UH-Slu-Lm8-n1]